MIEAAIAALFCGGYISFFVFLGLRSRRRDERPDQALERELAAAVGPLPHGLSLSAFRITGLRVKGTRLRLAGLAPKIDLRLDAAGAEGEAAGDAHDLGQPRIVSRGPARMVFALLQEPARAAWIALAESEGVVPDRLQVADGFLQVDVARPVDTRPGRLVQVAKAACAAAALLRTPDDVTACLLHNVAADPTLVVRRESLRILCREFAHHSATQEALRAAAAADAPELRLEAARRMGADGHAVLLGLLQAPGVDDSTRAAALDAVRTIPTDLAAELLERALARNTGGIAASLTARAVIDALRRAGVADAALLAEAVRAPVKEVALEAVGLLGDLGAADAVLPLEEVASSHLSSEVRAAALRAVADVQSRLPGAAPGQLSLSGDGAAGQISLADDAAGRLSTPAGRGRPDSP